MRISLTDVGNSYTVRKFVGTYKFNEKRPNTPTVNPHVHHRKQGELPAEQPQEQEEKQVQKGPEDSEAEDQEKTRLRESHEFEADQASEERTSP